MNRGSARASFSSTIIALALAWSLSLAATRSTQANSAGVAAIAELTALRDAYTSRIKADDFTCRIPAPTIVVDSTPSFGNYDDATNILHTAGWTKLSAEQHALFVELAGPNADEAAAHAAFEQIAHRWIFVHELGHWWQACRHANAKHSNYQIEYGANRIAIAYWREADPGFAGQMMQLFHDFLDHVPSPVPQGQATEPYFNSHYEQLGPTPAYRWFQARMIVDAGDEKPAPTFAKALAETLP